VLFLGDPLNIGQKSITIQKNLPLMDYEKMKERYNLFEWILLTLNHVFVQQNIPTSQESATTLQGVKL
jgi:hypothetical protein